VHAFGRTQLASEEFVQIGLSELEPRPKQRTFAGVGIDLLRFGTVQFAYGHQSFWDSSPIDTVGASYSLTMGAYGFLSLFANHTRSESSQTDMYLSWTMPLGARRSVGSSLSYRPDIPAGESFEATATVQQYLPPGSGSGYYLSVSSTESVRAELSYQGRAGQVGAEYSRRDDIDGWRATALGGVAITGAGVMPTRWLDQSFAVVQVANFQKEQQVPAEPNGWGVAVREGQRRVLSLPSPQCFPRDLELIGLATERPLELPNPLLQLLLALTLRLPGERLTAALQQLLPPAVVERLRDLVRPAQLLHRDVASQTREHDLQLLLRRERPVLPLLAQPDLPSWLSGPSCESRRTRSQPGKCLLTSGVQATVSPSTGGARPGSVGGQIPVGRQHAPLKPRRPVPPKSRGPHN